MKKYLFLLVIYCFPSSDSFAQTGTNVVISQVYGGGGNSGAPYLNDYIELFNPTASSINIAGWSVQYASATGSSWGVTPLTGVIPAGGYYLIQQTSGGANGIPLPTPDVTDNTNMAATAGKVALCNDAVALTGTYPTGGTIIDFIGYGATANCFEGIGSAPVPSNTLAIFRADSGCTDSNNNAADFSAATPSPRNSALPAHLCSPSSVFSNMINESNLPHVFPNPVSEICTMYNVQSAICRVEVYDALGNLVFSQQLTADSKQQIAFDVSHLISGVYFVLLKNEQRVFSEKFVIAR